MEKTKQFFVCFALDVDRDCPIPYKGERSAYSDYFISKGIKKSEFKASEKGLIQTLKILNEMKINANLFFEARTLLNISENKNILEEIGGHGIGCHGFDHEDFSSKRTDVRLDYNTKIEIIEKAKTTISQVLDKRCNGFRAPYLKYDKETLEVIADLKFDYDSSVNTRDKIYIDNFGLENDSYEPFLIETRKNSFIEFPNLVMKERDRSMWMYLWPLFEGQRNIQEYYDAIKQIHSKNNDGLLIISNHSWHIAYQKNQKRYLQKHEIEYNTEQLKKIFQFIIRLPNTRFVTMEEYIKEHKILKTMKI